ncbi:hypothetical protein AUJ46_04110 [Candidatus Peregrinibacteria bacterium CG1_02_54_53]|nr:MAG: hypothetical protein AUJ46_04110 [Candidatus Peregrinibacteria bacterium CG1_02_54_53]
MQLRPYQKLIAWKEAHALTLVIYRITAKFPDSERFGLISQMRRSGASAPTNIAEGNAKRSHRDRWCYFERASASLEELHYECLLSLDLGYLSPQEFEDCNSRIQRTSYLLTKLLASLK